MGSIKEKVDLECQEEIRPSPEKVDLECQEEIRPSSEKSDLECQEEIRPSSEKSDLESQEEIHPSSEKVDLESQEEIPSSSATATNKVQAFETSQCFPRSPLGRSWVYRKVHRFRLLRSIYFVVIKRKINLLLPFGTLAILLHYLTGKHEWVFYFSLVGITPLAESLAYTTEQLTFYTGPTVGGLLRFTFCNATEILVSIYALKSDMMRVVQQSLLGSSLSNMLLVLGLAFFCGGIVHHQKVQVFSKVTALVNSRLLFMAVMGISFPAVLHFTHTEVHFGKSELALSRFCSCIMMIAYASYIFFQLRSRTNLYSCIEEDNHKHMLQQVKAHKLVKHFQPERPVTKEHEDNAEAEVPEITQREAIVWLAILTLWISVLSGYLVDAIPGSSDSMNMPVAFIGVILLKIAEHASAIKFAMKDKLDITLEAAIGSSTQILMFVMPFCVVVGWIMGKPMDLNFQLFETLILFLAVLVVAFTLQEGTSNYFNGLILILCYLFVAASFFLHVDR